MKLLFVTGSRADWSKLWPLVEFSRDAGHECSVFPCCGWVPDPCTVPTIGEDPILFGHIADEIAEVAPDFDAVVVHGDRAEALAAASGASLAGVKIVHVEGGEHSGSVDQAFRWAISAMATAHAVCSMDALVALQEPEQGPQRGEHERIFIVGSPERRAPMPERSPANPPYGILMCHSVPTNREETEAIAEAVRAFLANTPIPFKVFSPNSDRYCELLTYAKGGPTYDVIYNLPHGNFAKLLAGATVIIGNSSAVVREAPWYGVPAVCIGTRQRDRVCMEGGAIRYATPNAAAIAETAKLAIASSYTREQREEFGDGNPRKPWLKLLDRLPSLSFEK